MKKHNLAVGVVYLLAGLAVLGLALLTETKLESLLFGFAGAGIVPGAIMICKYIYWSSPERRARYAEKLEAEEIELHDERKEKLRDKSGRYAYLLGLFVVSVSIVAVAVLEKLEVLAEGRVLLLYLAGYLLLQIAAGIAIYRGLAKKY